MKKFFAVLLAMSFMFSCVSPGFAGYGLFAQREALRKQLEEAKRSGNTARENAIRKKLEQLKTNQVKLEESLKLLENHTPDFSGLN